QGCKGVFVPRPPRGAVPPVPKPLQTVQSSADYSWQTRLYVHPVATLLRAVARTAASSHRQPDIVLGNAGLRGPARRDVVELGTLHRPFEWPVFREPVHQARERPREALRLPHTRERLG